MAFPAMLGLDEEGEKTPSSLMGSAIQELFPCAPTAVN